MEHKYESDNDSAMKCGSSEASNESAKEKIGMIEAADNANRAKWLVKMRAFGRDGR